MTFGQSFSPTNGSQPQGATGQPSSPVMDAIKILSFRVPQTLGATAPTSAALLNAPGSGITNAALIQQWLQRFFGGQLGQPGTLAPTNTSVGAPSSPFGTMPTGLPSAPIGGARPSVQFPAQGVPRDTAPIQAPSPIWGEGQPAAPATPPSATPGTWGSVGGVSPSIGPAVTSFR